MKKYLLAALLSVFCLAFLFTGCNENPEPTEPTSSSEESTTVDPDPYTGPTSYKQWIDSYLFAHIPAYISDHTVIGELTDVGGGWFSVDINNATVDDFKAYSAFLQENGYDEVVNNGEDGLDGYVYSTTLQSEKYTITLCLMTAMKKLYVEAIDEVVYMSKYLTYDADAVAANPAGSVNKLYMRELYDFGNSYVFVLKNGHFFLNDGGLNDQDCENLLQLLESLVPKGEIPVIDELFITHAHADHAGFLAGLLSNDANAERVRINEMLYAEPSKKFLQSTGTTEEYIRYLNMVGYMFQTEDGGFPQVARPQTGQRYYFNDIEADVILSTDQLPLEDISGDFNDSSTWFMYTIEGQRLLFGGDGEWGGMMKIMQTYPSEYISCDIFHVLHHGYNTWNQFTDYCKCTVAIDSAPVLRTANADNYYLQDRVKEWLNWGQGTQVLTFPYKPGTAKTLPHIPEYTHVLK